jgi:hypothetical protein
MGRFLVEESTVRRKLGYCTPVNKIRFFVNDKVKPPRGKPRGIPRGFLAKESK